MISEEERKRALEAEKWGRHNLFWVIGAAAVAFAEFSSMLGTSDTSFGLLQEGWKRSSAPLIWRIAKLSFIVYLYAKATQRIKTIESLASNWEDARQLGRGMIVFAKRCLIASLLFWGVEVIMVAFAFSH